MKIERISPTSVRVILNNEDLAKRSIDVKTLLSDTDAYQKLIWDVVEHAEIELGADIYTGKVKIENVSSDSDSFEFTITDLTDHTAVNPEQDRETKSPEAPLDAQDDFPDGLCDNAYLKRELENRAEFLFSDGTGVIWFQNFNEMQTFFKANQGFSALASKLYQLNESFYVTVHASKASRRLLPLLDILIADCNAAYLPCEIFKPILEEYGTVIFKNGAIKKIINAM